MTFDKIRSARSQLAEAGRTDPSVRQPPVQAYIFGAAAHPQG